MFPVLMHTVIDTADVPRLSEFYCDLLGLRERPGDDETWTVLLDGDGRRVLALQHVEEVTPSTWPSPDVPQQLHLDFRVPSVEELERHRARAEALGAVVVLDRSADTSEPLYVLRDPAGHPFCLLVSAG